MGAWISCAWEPWRFRRERKIRVGRFEGGVGEGDEWEQREREREKEEKRKKEKKWCWVRIYRKKSYTFREVTGIVRVRACVRERERDKESSVVEGEGKRSVKCCRKFLYFYRLGVRAGILNLDPVQNRCD